MADPTEADRLRQLADKLKAVEAARKPAPPVPNKYTSASLAWRMVIELVVGISVGFGIGMGLDALFGTRPIFLVLFVLLGFAAGVRVMMSTAAEVNPAGGAAATGQNRGTPPNETER